jgi:hypothetical protein
VEWRVWHGGLDAVGPTAEAKEGLSAAPGRRGPTRRFSAAHGGAPGAAADGGGAARIVSEIGGRWFWEEFH